MRAKLLILTFLTFVLITFAIPTMPGIWRTAKLADGTEIRLEQVGDENLHYWRDVRGVCYNVDDEGVATPIANIGVVRAKAATRIAQNNARRAAAATRTVGISRRHVGKRKGLIVLVNFTDVRFQPAHTKSLLSRMANEEGFTYKDGHRGSLHDYFKDQSNGLFHLTFDVVGPVQLRHNMAYYGKDTLDWRGSRSDVRAGQMVAEACLAIKDSVNFRDYDWDGDNVVDQVLVIYAGYGQASGGGSNTIWPHEWALQYSDYGRVLRIDGHPLINTYACSNELNPNSTSLGGFGTACHEFTHCLGLPDMYDTSGKESLGMGFYDLMSAGNYNGEGYVPAGYTSYEKMFVGWLTPQELTRDTTITGMKPLSEHGEAFIIRNDANADEYYLLENRQRSGWDSHLPGEGLLVLHVDFDQMDWLTNRVNANPQHQRCTLVPADNRQRKILSAQDSIPYPQA
ncbi:MAG: M6 family metalloprotease domain-containing protein, partial [Prevotella conceptionensis]